MATTVHDERLIAPSALLRAREVTRAADPRSIERALRSAIRGEVRFDDGSRALYATDASNYRYVPIGVCIPTSREDVEAIVAVARAHGAPIVSRAGGTGLAGQTCNTAIVIDWSKYMHRILSLDPERRVARVEPGVICDQLADAAKPFGLTYGPKPATHTHCCFGGMLGNNSCGIHAQMAGKAVDNTEEMEILLYDGTRMRVGWMTDDEFVRAGSHAGREGEIYRSLRALRDRFGPAVERRFPHIPRRVSGYNLDSLLPDAEGRLNVARALVGSESTLITILEATVRLVPDPPHRALVIVGYPDIYRAADHIPDVLACDPIGLEGIDSRLRDHVAVRQGPHAKFLKLLPDGDGWLFCEFGGQTEEEARERADRLVARLGNGVETPSTKIVTDPVQQQHLWDVRESGLGATAFVPGEPDAWTGFEDSAVAPEKLGAYLRDLRALFEAFQYQPSVYGHFGMGCVHCRINFDLKTEPGVKKFRAFMEQAAQLVARYGGSLSGEHGDGQARAELLPIMFGEEIVSAFREMKSIFDPLGKMNPGRVVDPNPIDANLRFGPGYEPWRPETHFHFTDDHGSFAHATTRCVGIGNCRRLHGKDGEDDTMCPSFMVTREEKHTTRGRAHLLFEMLQRGPIDKGWRDENVKEALDLCLACKGCKGDCPVNVDIATYKAEFLSHYYEGRIRPRSAYAFGLIDQWSRLASIAPGVVNLVTQTPGLSAIAKWAAGMPQERKIPAFAPRTFQSWFAAREVRNVGAPQVILWPDTFNNHFMPETAQAAVEVLEHAGFQVTVPKGHFCCGRPLYDYGFLDLAKRYLHHVLDGMSEAIAHRTPVVVLEPSCASVFRDEMCNLLPDRGDARTLSEHTYVLSEFLRSTRARARGFLPPKLERKALVQGHCHHKSVIRFEDEKNLLDDMSMDAEILASGCCGMAGSFGYEKGRRYEVSIAAGERVLLPCVREAAPDTLLLADGFSCREQIMQETDRHALHVAEALKLAIDGNSEADPAARIASTRRRAVHRSMARAAVAIGVIGIAAVVAASVRRLR
jgi:FAD/FMN-containing dehydrogenase/Fe-S oxidoreductase